jgi:hypothetical protein
MISTVKERKNNCSNLLVIIILFFSCSFANAQWISKKVDNGFDEPYSYAYVESTDKIVFLKIQSYVDDDFAKKIAFFVAGEIFCGTEPIFIELSFQVNGENKKYGLLCPVQESEKSTNLIAVISTDLKSEDYLSYFKSCSSMKIRITNENCEMSDNEGPVIYSYKMSGSTAALTFVSKY